MKAHLRFEGHYGDSGTIISARKAYEGEAEVFVFEAASKEKNKEIKRYYSYHPLADIPLTSYPGFHYDFLHTESGEILAYSLYKGEYGKIHCGGRGPYADAIVNIMQECNITPERVMIDKIKGKRKRK